jgi:prophage maintenance system killer protein
MVTAEAFVFLAINGLEIVATDAESQDFILGLYSSGDFSFDPLRGWLADHTESVKA